MQALAAIFMRNFISIGILILLTSSTNAQLSDADAFFKGTYDKAFIRKHKIKQVFVDIFIDGKKSTFYIFQFDKKGLLKKQTILDSSQNNVNDYIFKYNKYGDQIERTNIAYDLNKTYKVTFLKKYNGSQLVSDKSSDLPFLTEYSYNSKGQIKETSTISGWDSLNNSKQISIYNYDTTGKLRTIKDLIVTSNGSTNVLETTTFTYDTSGRIVSVFRDNAPAYYISYDSNFLIKSKRTKMPEDLGSLEIIDNYSYSFWK
jgi:hypothetical protein